MRILLIFNASASSVTARARVVIQQALGAGHDLTVAATSRRGHATRLAQGAASDGVDVVVVLGGDGTLNEAANGLAGTGTALGVLPGGSTNVYARTIGMANDPIGATRQLLESLGAGRVLPVSLGNVNGRYFLFHVGLGFDAAVVAGVEKHSFLKRQFGAVIFLATAAATWAGYDRRSPWFAVRTPDGDTIDGYFAVGLKTNPYTFLGGSLLDVAPGTGFASGLSLVVCKSFTLPTLLSLIGASIGRPRAGQPAGPGGTGRGDRSGSDGRLGRRWLPFGGPRRIVFVRDVERVEVTAYRPLPYQVDGDYLGEADRLTVRCVPDALRLVVPVTPLDRPPDPQPGHGQYVKGVTSTPPAR